MANGKTNTVKQLHSVTFLPKEFKKRIGNNFDYVDTDSRWIYKKLLVTEAARDMFTDFDSFIGDVYEVGDGSATETYDNTDVSADYLLWLYLRHTGFSSIGERETSKSAHPIMWSIGDAAPTFSGTGTAQPLVLFPGESIGIRFSGNGSMKLEIPQIAVARNVFNELSQAGVSGDTVLVEIAALAFDAA